MTIESFQTLYATELRSLFDAENQLTPLLPELESAAHHPHLKTSLQQYQGQSDNHAILLAKLLGQISESTQGINGKAMQGLVKEARTMLAAHAENDLRDAGLIAALQRIIHAKIAGYGTALAHARQLGETEGGKALAQFLAEEKDMDHRLTSIAMGSVNRKAQYKINSTQNGKPNGSMSLLMVGALIGGLTGIAAGLLLAPGRGADTRKRLAGSTRHWMNRMNHISGAAAELINRNLSKNKKAVSVE